MKKKILLVQGLRILGSYGPSAYVIFDIIYTNVLYLLLTLLFYSPCRHWVQVLLCPAAVIERTFQSHRQRDISRLFMHVLCGDKLHNWEECYGVCIVCLFVSNPAQVRQIILLRCLSPVVRNGQTKLDTRLDSIPWHSHWLWIRNDIRVPAHHSAMLSLLLHIYYIYIYFIVLFFSYFFIFLHPLPKHRL